MNEANYLGSIVNIKDSKMCEELMDKGKENVLGDYYHHTYNRKINY